VNDYFQEYLVISAYSNDFSKKLIFRVLKILLKNSDLQNQKHPKLGNDIFYTFAEGIMLLVRSLQRSEGDVCDPIKYIYS